jgi:DNA polymerase-3 subunit delta'
MSWRAIKGHDAIAAGFARAVARGRLAHAFLFVGLPGIGKRQFARQLAKTMLCEAPPSECWDSCDQCAACKLVDAGTHPDVFQVSRPEDKHELPIATIQQLQTDLALKPARGSRKIAIVDDADDLNEESANSFLKTLEEPPPGSVVVLIGTNADRQLPTIRSRCQVIPFQSLPEPTIAALLESDPEIDAAQIPRLARLSGGSLGLARELADPALWEYRSRLVAEMTVERPDVGALAKAFMAVVELAGKESGVQRRRAALLVRLLIQGLDAALVGAAVTSADDGRILQALRALGPDRLVALIERCLEASEQIERRVQLVLVVEALVSALLVLLT